MKTALYRHFDKNNALLYVGISFDAIHRYKQHVKDEKCWIDDIYNMTIQWFLCREEAIDAEKIAIQSENPLWNIALKKIPIKKKNFKYKTIKKQKIQRKRYSNFIEYEVRTSIRFSKEEIEQKERYFKSSNELNNFEIGQLFFRQEIGGIYSRHCEVFKIIAIEETFLVIEYLKSGREDVIIRGSNFIDRVYFINENYYDLNSDQKKEFEGIDIKKSLEICGYDPRHFGHKKALSATRVIAFCPDCNEFKECFLSHYYERKIPYWVGNIRKPCDWHLKSP